MRRRRLISCVLYLLALVALVDVSRRLLLSRSLYELNLAVGSRLETLAPPQAGQRILVFAPHPDDETLGAGAYIQQAVAAGAEVTVVVVTNGEYPEMSVVLAEKTIPRHPDQFIRLGYARQRETLEAMALLGVPPDHVIFLGYPNGYLDQMWSPRHWTPGRPVRSLRTRAVRSPYRNSFTPGAVYCGQSLLDDIKLVLRLHQPDVAISLHPNDVHLDHWPTAAFVSAALEELRLSGSPFARTCTRLAYLIHRNHWPVPRGYRPWLTLEPPASLLALGATEWRALPVSLAQTIDKHHATARYRTQGGGVDPLLEAFCRATELYGIVPVGEWPAGSDTDRTVVVRDAQKDLDLIARRPYADITEVSLARRESELVAELVTRGAPSAKVTYHLSFHGGRATPGQRVIADFSWRAGRLQGAICRNGALNRLAPERARLTTSGRTTRLCVPWLLSDAAPGYFIVRVWTTAGRRTLDLAGFATFRLVPSRGH